MNGTFKQLSGLLLAFLTSGTCFLQGFGLILGVDVLGLSTLNPGFEGAKCYFYGSYFPWQNYAGAYALHRYQDAESSLLSKSSTGTATENIYWGNLATPNDASMVHKYSYGGRDWYYPNLGIHVESNVQLQDITRQGNPDPLNWNSSNPLDAQRIEYFSKVAVKEDLGDKIVYHWSAQKESFLVVPAEFWVGMYVVPDQGGGSNPLPGSGWREGDWENVVLWFMLDWATWDNAYADAWLNDVETNVFNSAYDGAILNQKKLSDYRGGFPITGWIQEWEKAGFSSSRTGEVQSPVWLSARSKENSEYTIDELANLQTELLAKCQTSPGLIGQFLSLYTGPDVTFDYLPLDSTSYSADALAKDIQSPDSRMRKVMYFPINIVNVGSLTIGDIWNGWTVYYPSVYLRVRMLYGVYGNFTYLWTEELAKDPLVDYPDQIELHDTQVIHVAGIGAMFSGIAGILSNPIFWFFLGLILLVVLLVLLALLVPGSLTLVSALGKAGAKHIEGKMKNQPKKPRKAKVLKPARMK